MSQAKFGRIDVKEVRSADSRSASFGQSETPGACGCCGTPERISISRSKTTMNEINETTNKTTTVTAPEIVCGGCASSIKKALGTVSGVAEVDVDVATKKVTVKHNDSVSQESIADALDRAGYSAVAS